MDQTAAIPVTDRILETWTIMADQYAPYILPGQINWVMMVRSLMTEINHLKNLRGRNAVLDRHVHRLEIELSQAVDEITDLRSRLKGVTP